MMKKIAKWFVFILLLGYATIAALWADHQADLRKCTGIDVNIISSQPSEFITAQGVKNELGKLSVDFSSRCISEINLDSIERFLSKDNRFESVQCAEMNTGKLRIDIVPMIPELRVFTPKESYYINKDGKRINANIEFVSDVPVINGNFNDAFPASSLLPVTRYIAKDSVLKSLITMINADSPTNIILLPRIKGHVINLGDTSDLKNKFDNLLLMYHKVMPYKGWETYDTISLKFKGQIVATRRNKSKAVHSTASDDGIDIEEASLQGQDMIVTGNETEP